MIEIKVSDLRNRGKNGYVAKLSKFGDRMFLQANKRTGYSKSHEILTFYLTEEGIYEVSDANHGNTSKKVYYLRINKNGDLDGQADSFEELLTDTLELPELQGTSRQVAWATELRRKLAAVLVHQERSMPPWLFTETDATYWIDRRDKISAAIAKLKNHEI